MKGNPFRPGAGHPPPYLAGRKSEKAKFSSLLQQDVILTNVVLTGLRGVGKTALLSEFRPMAIDSGWAWVGSDLSEAVSVSEDNLALRILTDLSVFSSTVTVRSSEQQKVGFNAPTAVATHEVNYDYLNYIYSSTPGLVVDKIKSVLRTVAKLLPPGQKIIFAYDEAQTLSDNAQRDQFPLSVLLDVFQAVQREELPYMLVLTGLPTLFPKLVEARTYAERMFTVLFLNRLKKSECIEAIRKPLKKSNTKLTDESINSICKLSSGYPYFIQFFCYESYEIWKMDSSKSIPLKELVLKLDNDFFVGRWHKATDRQKELMFTIAELKTGDTEFTVQEIVNISKCYENPFNSSHVNQMLSALCDKGLIYKNRYGKYSFAVPLLYAFINRQESLLVPRTGD